MTPLATMFFGQLGKPLDKRTAQDPDGVMRMLTDLHCFEVSQLWDPIQSARSQSGLAASLDLLWEGMFLPSPRTWLEWVDDDGFRKAMLLEEHAGRLTVHYAMQRPFGAWRLGLLYNDHLPGHSPVTVECHNPRSPIWARFPTPEARGNQFGDVGIDALLMLDIINTPGLVERVEHEPNKGLSRRLANFSRGFPLQAWHEVVIDPRHRHPEPTGGHLTGRKCLHFVRAHRRRLADRTTVVSSHWRGDAALGLKRTRYAVRPPSPAMAPGSAIFLDPGRNR